MSFYPQHPEKQLLFAADIPPPPHVTFVTAPDRRTLHADGSTIGSGLSMSRPSSTPSRLIIDVYPVKCMCCCGPEAGVQADVLTSVPDVLLKRGMDPATWMHWMRLLDDAIRHSRANMLAIIVACSLIIPIPFVVAGHNRRQRRIKRLVDAFNTQVLNRYGMYAKTQKGLLQVDKYHEEISWLAIALTPMESQQLAMEEHVWLYDPFRNSFHPNDGVCSCANSCCGTPVVI